MLEKVRPRDSRRQGALLAAALLAAALAPEARSETVVTLEPVAMTGALAPDAGAGAYFVGFQLPLLNEGGISFGGILAGGGITPGLDHFGLWHAGPSQAPALVARLLDETDEGETLVALDRLVPPEARPSPT